MGLMFTSCREGATVATVGSWFWLVATKLKPRNNWCVFALGGIPGESGYVKKKHNNKYMLCLWLGFIKYKGKSKHGSFHLSFCHFIECIFQLPVGVLEVNSGSKWKVSSGLPTVGLKGGLISFLYNFYREQTKNSCIRNDTLFELKMKNLANYKSLNAQDMEF